MENLNGSRSFELTLFKSDYAFFILIETIVWTVWCVIVTPYKPTHKPVSTIFLALLLFTLILSYKMQYMRFEIILKYKCYKFRRKNKEETVTQSHAHCNFMREFGKSCSWWCNHGFCRLEKGLYFNQIYNYLVNKHVLVCLMSKDQRKMTPKKNATTNSKYTYPWPSIKCTFLTSFPSYFLSIKILNVQLQKDFITFADQVTIW